MSIFWDDVIKNANGKLPNREPDFSNDMFLHWWKEEELTEEVSKHYKKKVAVYITATGVPRRYGEEPLILYVLIDEKSRLADSKTKEGILQKAIKNRTK